MRNESKVLSPHNSNFSQSSAEKEQHCSDVISKSFMQTVLDTLSVFTGKNDILEVSDDGLNGKHAHFTENLYGGNDEKCPYNMPVSLQDKVKRKPRKKRIPYKEQFHTLFEQSELGHICDRVIKKTALILLNRIPHIFYKDEEDVMKVFEGRSVWASCYSNFIRAKIYVATQLFHKLYKHAVFVTLTYQYNKYGRDNIEACKTFQKQSDKIIQAVRKRNPGAHICVNEATAKGYPHAHILFFSNKPFQENWDNLPCNKKIKFGAFFNFLKERVASPVFDIKKPYDNNLVNYLTKYISKNSTADLKKIAEKEGSLTKTERKELLTILLFQMAGVRRIRTSSCKEVSEIFRKNKEEYLEKKKHEYSEKDGVYTIGSTVKKEEEKKEFDLVNTFPTYEQIEEIMADKNRRKAFLIQLCIKSVAPCLSHTWVSTSAKVSAFLDDQNREKGLTSEELEDFAKNNCIKVGCHGCLISHFFNLLRTGSDDWFKISNPKPKYEDKLAVDMALDCLERKIAIRRSHPLLNDYDWRVGMFFSSEGRETEYDYGELFMYSDDGRTGKEGSGAGSLSAGSCQGVYDCMDSANCSVGKNRVDSWLNRDLAMQALDEVSIEDKIEMSILACDKHEYYKLIMGLKYVLS